MVSVATLTSALPVRSSSSVRPSCRACPRTAHAVATAVHQSRVKRALPVTEPAPPPDACSELVSAAVREARARGLPAPPQGTLVGPDHALDLARVRALLELQTDHVIAIGE